MLAFLFGFVRLDWSLLGEPVLFVSSALSGGVLIVMAGAEDIAVAYGGYLAFRALYQMLITVARCVILSAVQFKDILSF